MPIEFYRQEAQAARAALRMIGDAIEELFGPAANLESEVGTIGQRGPEYHHRAEAIIEALQRIAVEPTVTRVPGRPNRHAMAAALLAISRKK